MPLTDKPSVVNQALVDLLVKDWEGIGCELKSDIYYGDQSRYPRFPSISVEAAPTERVLNQTGLQQRILFTSSIMAYYGPIVNAEERWKESDELAERVIAQLHTDRRLGGLIIHGHPTNSEPGFVNRGGLLTVHRITWEGISNFTMP
ncbi:MAG: hypothetical protein ACW99G_20235 [Candidatus Thorarchaeota archaeon]|jgi:hypothetical protein